MKLCVFYLLFIMRILLTMERTKIERYVVDLLTVSAVNRDGGERSVYDTLYHLLMAVASYEQLSDDEKSLVTSLKKKLQYFFCARFSLKERKETKKKKNFPPNPLIKEKAKKETEEKECVSVDVRREVFHQECLKRLRKYDAKRLADFYHYYSEENRETGKMRFEEETYWNIDNRLELWVGNQYSKAIATADTRQQRLEKKQKQQAVAQTRQEDNERVWQEIEERKKGAVSREEWLAMKKKKESDEAG